MYSRVYVEVTNVCNKNCSFCHGTHRAPRMMSFSEFSLVAEKLRPLTGYLYFHLMGEPLLHPELPRFISHASSLGFRCAVTTNGSLLDSRGDELIAAGVYKVNVSLHRFAEEGETEAYLEKCFDFADRASEAGVLTVLRLWNGAGNGGENAALIARLRERFAGSEWRFGPRGARIRHKLHLEYGERFEWPDMSAPDMGSDVFCYGLSDHFGILADGTIVPCCLDADGAVPLGNAFDGDIAAALQGERAVKMREGFKCRRASEELCRRCGYARRFSRDISKPK